MLFSEIHYVLEGTQKNLFHFTLNLLLKAIFLDTINIDTYKSTHELSAAVKNDSEVLLEGSMFARGKKIRNYSKLDFSTDYKVGEIVFSQIIQAD